MRKFDFSNLIDLCKTTHEHLHNRAARSVDIALVIRNWLFGWYIVEFENGGAERSELYGKRLISRLACELKAQGLLGMSPTNLRKFREFYRAYPEIQQTLSVKSSREPDNRLMAAGRGSHLPSMPVDSKAVLTLSGEMAARFNLGWSHYVTLLTVSDPEERRFYEIEAAANSWGVRELERQIASSLYERLALSRDKNEIRRLAQEGLVVEKAADIIKNPLVLEFLGLEKRLVCSESDIETAIIDKIETFLLELGKGFLFEARQKRFTFDNDHFYVDLVFYNRLLHCFVLIDLKRDKLTHQDLGQMQMYVNHFDRHVKTTDEAPTIGIVLCHRKHDALVELTLPEDANIYASKYQLYLPSKEELRRKLMDWTAEQETKTQQTIRDEKTGS